MAFTNQNLELTSAGLIKYAGANTPGWTCNLTIQAATTTTANDSIKITSAAGTALSITNPGWVTLESTASPGQLTSLKMTADVTINLTGAHWGQGTLGDLTDAILQVIAINDAGTLKWGVEYQIGRQVITDTLESATGTDINLPEEVLVNSLLGANSTCLEAFWFKANFDDTGGAAEDLWAVQTGTGDLNGGSANGQWHPYNSTFSGFSANPTITFYFCQIGRTVHVKGYYTVAGTSNQTWISASGPIKAERTFLAGVCHNFDNGAAVTTVGLVASTANSKILELYIDGRVGSNNYTATGSKGMHFTATYEADIN